MDKLKNIAEKLKNVVIKYKFLLPVLIVGLFLCFNLTSTYKKQVKEEHTVSYNKFCEYVESGEVDEVYLNGTNTFTFTLKSKDDSTTELWYCTNPDTETFKEYLLLNDVKLPDTINANTTKSYILSLVPLLLVMAVYVIIFIKMQGNDSSEKIGSVTKVPDIRFSDVAGLHELKEDLTNIIKIMQNKDEYKDTSIKIPRGILLEGEPGNGKTMIAKAFAGECGMKFIPVNASNVGGIFAGLGSRHIQTIFKNAKKNAPCIIFIDEIDSIASKRMQASNSVTSDDNKTVNAILNAMDGFNSNDDVLVLAATNRAEDMDPAILRPGRFDKKFIVPKPDFNARKELLELELKNKNIDDSISIDELARSFSGLSCASISTIINEAGLIMIKDSKQAITYSMIETAYTQMVTKGSIKKVKTRTEKENIMIAWHEAGHALMTKILTKEIVEKISILETTSNIGGFTVSNDEEEHNLLSLDDIQNKIMVLYAGRAAEYLLNNKNESLVTIGCSNDIMEATKYLVLYNRFSSSNGLIDYSALPGDYVVPKNNQLDKMSRDIWEQTVSILEQHNNQLKYIADELLNKEVLYNTDIERILSGPDFI